MKTESLDGYLYEKAVKIFIILTILCLFVSFCIVDSKDILGLRSSRKTISNIQDIESLLQINWLEVIFVSLIQICTSIEYIISYIKDNILKRILSLKYFCIFSLIHICYALIVIFIL